MTDRRFELPELRYPADFDKMADVDPLFHDTVCRFIEETTMEEFDDFFQGDEDCVFVSHTKKR